MCVYRYMKAKNEKLHHPIQGVTSALHGLRTQVTYLRVYLST